MVDVKSFASEATNHLSQIFMGNAEQAAKDIENRFRDPATDKDLRPKRAESKMLTYDEVLHILTFVNIEDGYKTINDKMYPYFYRLFDLNIQERNKTMVLLGTDAVVYGDQDSLTPMVQPPKYAEGMTYADFMREAKLAEKNGQLSTMYDTTTYSKFYNNGQLYKKTVNLYPDENDTGLHGESDYEFNKWDACCNPNSILYKTKVLFKQRKINTLISRFGTHADEGGGTLEYNGENGDPLYGESRGRNLLTKDAETHGGTYNVNGYNNPYCRVWTHHHQYGKYFDTMRPFLDNDKPVTNKDFHKWNQFSIDDDIFKCGLVNENSKKPWGWKNGNPNWEKSVLDKDTGILNITPKYRDPGKSSNIHTKDCMFSIENLAWKDYDPYSFERALSWEQRGPMGGRIMWFPPYGLSFNEAVTTEWTENKFIGRGESVYSYANTKRSGTLEFLMVVDHPSATDYALWYNDADTFDSEVSDTDLLRFFAGCDKDSVLNAAKPTPLTDEYLNFGVDDNTITTAEPEIIKKDAVKPEIIKKDAVKTFKSKLYFPNNYTGLWDIYFFNSNPLGYIFNGIDADNLAYETGKDYVFAVYPFNDVSKGFWAPLARSLTNKEYFGSYGYEMFSEDRGITKCASNTNCSICNGFMAHDKTFISDDVTDFKKKFLFGYKMDGMPQSPGQIVSNDTVYGLVFDGNNIDGNNIDENNIDEKKVINYVGLKSKTYQNQKYKEPVYTRDNVFENIKKEKLTNNYSSNTWGQLLSDDERIDKENGRRNVDFTSDYIPFTYFSAICALLGSKDGDVTYTKNTEYESETKTKEEIFNKLCGTITDEANKKKIDEFKNVLLDNFDNVTGIEIEISGNASQDGGKTGNTATESRNIYLAGARAYSTQLIIEKLTDVQLQGKLVDGKSSIYEKKIQFVPSAPTANANSQTSKDDRCAEVIMTIHYRTEETIYQNKNVGSDNVLHSMGIITQKEHDSFLTEGYVQTGEYVTKAGVLIGANISKKPNGNPNEKPVFLNSEGTKVVEYSRGKWATLDKYIAMCSMYNDQVRMDGDVYTRATGRRDATAVNKIRYDQEYHFFKKLSQENPLVFQRLVDKLQYFDPAFHSMTPEGFNARLTFLHQCTRQGDTTTASDNASTSANNLAFGRPPFCMLRIGDFYNQMIVIRSLNLDYSVSEGIMWDLNQEGVGVQPLLCKVSIGFDFIGGGDLAGPVRRLQNAMSFNYYANTGLYDNRADRPFYEWDDKTGKSEFKPDKSYAHSVTKDYEHLFAGNIADEEYVSGMSEAALGVRKDLARAEEEKRKAEEKRERERFNQLQRERAEQNVEYHLSILGNEEDVTSTGDYWLEKY